MNPIDRARKIRGILNDYTAKMPDEEAAKKAVLFPEWDGNGVQYSIGDRVLYKDKLYKVLQNHKSQPDWTPDAAVSLFAEIPDPETIPDWVQPDSTNPYVKGDKVRFEGKIYESVIDNNVWSPAAYPAGWKEIVNGE
jgi:hypothetical protein